MPPEVAIRPNAFGLGLFATQPFQAGDTLYIASCLYVPDIVPGKVTLRLTGSKEEYTLDMQEHSVVQSDLPGKRQLYTYDAFMNHACDPNTTSFVTGCTSAALTYGMKALRDIATGESSHVITTCSNSTLGTRLFFSVNVGRGSVWVPLRGFGI